MQISFFIVLVGITSGLYAQEQSPNAYASTKQSRVAVQDVFTKNFPILDSVAQGTKKQNSLNANEVAFVYLVSSWSNLSSGINYFESMPKVDQSHVQHWKNWFNTNSKVIDESDYNRCITIYLKVLTEGIASDDELELLDEISKRYNVLPKHKK